MIIVDKESYGRELPHLLSTDTWVVDVETNGLNSFGMNQICGIGIATEDSAYYFPFRHQQGTNLQPDILVDLMKHMNERKKLIGYNIKFDLHFLSQDGLDITDMNLIDVLVMVRLTEHSTVKDLDLTSTLKRSYGEEAAQYDIETKKYLRSNKWHKDFSLAPADVLGEYCIKDVEWTRQLFNDRLKKIEQSEQIPIFNMECELTKVLFQMEQRGIPIDSKYAADTIEKIDVRKESVATNVFTTVGKEFNLSSTQQLGEVFNENGIFSAVTTPKGKQSWGEEALIRINNPLAGLVRQYRSLTKLQSTYLEPYLETDVMHTSFCNWGTLTGRLSSREPNLQNIPRNHFKLRDVKLSPEEREDTMKRIHAILGSKGTTLDTELSDNVIDTWGFVGDESFNEDAGDQIAMRRLFIPRKEYSLLGFDYSQMEVRVFLSYLQNDEIDELLKNSDVDFHGEAAKMAFDVEEDSSEFKFYRQMAKAITFGTIYGIGNKKLAAQLGTTPREAGQYKRKYFAGLKGSKEFFDKVVQTVESRGWIKNRFGRQYRLPKDLGYKGVNYLVQGTSADIMNERMIAVGKYLADKKSNLLLQVHDEIICEIHNDELETVPEKIKEMLQVNSLDIPLYVDMEICNPSWATKKDFVYSKPKGVEDYIDWDF